MQKDMLNYEVENSIVLIAHSGFETLLQTKDSLMQNSNNKAFGTSWMRFDEALQFYRQ